MYLHILVIPCVEILHRVQVDHQQWVVHRLGHKQAVLVSGVSHQRPMAIIQSFYLAELCIPCILKENLKFILK